MPTVAKLCWVTDLSITQSIIPLFMLIKGALPRTRHELSAFSLPVEKTQGKHYSNHFLISLSDPLGAWTQTGHGQEILTEHILSLHFRRDKLV